MERPQQLAAAPLRVLVVDDDTAMLRLISKWLTSGGHQVSLARDGVEAVAALQGELPDVVLTDWEMPRLDGIGLCRWIRQQHLPRYVYVVFLTVRGGSSDLVTCLRNGADDFLKKPIDRCELLARMHAAHRVLELESRQHMLARTDPLTGLANEDCLVETMQRELVRGERYQRSQLSCAIVQPDFSFAAGEPRRSEDHLCMLATLLQRESRYVDVVGRLNGGQLCVLLPETSETAAMVWAERVRQACRIATPPGSDGQPLTVSIGVAQSSADHGRPLELIDLARQAVGVAQQQGGDRSLPGSTLQASTHLEIEAARGYFRGLEARHVMSVVVAALEEHITVEATLDYFLHLRIQSAPVVDGEGMLVGIVSQRDLMRVMLRPNCWELTLKEVMQTAVVAYQEDHPLLAIYQFLSRVALRSVVIVRAGRPVGILSRATVLRWFLNARAAELARQPGVEQPTDAEASQPATCTAQKNDFCRRVQAAATALGAEAERLQQLMQQPHEQPYELLPHLIGGATRVQELAGDVLGLSRFAQPLAAGQTYLAEWSDETSFANENIASLPA